MNLIPFCVTQALRIHLFLDNSLVSFDCGAVARGQLIISFCSRAEFLNALKIPVLVVYVSGRQGGIY